MEPLKCHSLISLLFILNCLSKTLVIKINYACKLMAISFYIFTTEYFAGKCIPGGWLLLLFC